jgi:hypothetical protein
METKTAKEFLAIGKVKEKIAGRSRLLHGTNPPVFLEEAAPSADPDFPNCVDLY